MQRGRGLCARSSGDHAIAHAHRQRTPASPKPPHVGFNPPYDQQDTRHQGFATAALDGLSGAAAAEDINQSAKQNQWINHFA